MAMKWGLSPGRTDDYLLEMRRDVGMLEVAREHIISENVSGEVIRPDNEELGFDVNGESWEELLDYSVDGISRKIMEARSDFQAVADETHFSGSRNLPEKDRQANLNLVMREYSRNSDIPETVMSTVDGEKGLMEKWKDAESLEDVKQDLIDVIKAFRAYSGQDYGEVMEIWEPNIDPDEIDRMLSRIKTGSIRILEKLDTENVRKVWEKADNLDESEELRETVENPAAVHEVLANYILGGNPARMPVRIGNSGMEYGNSIMAPLQTVDNSFWAKALDTTAHEYGHTFGRQNLPHEHVFLPLGEPPSEAVDEGTARFYQNHVFRSESFLKQFMSKEGKEWLRYHGIPDFKPEELYRWFNAIDPDNRQRISADPITYPLHVVIRYEIEKELIESIEPVESIIEKIHTKWENKLQSYIGDPLGVQVESLDQKETVLQDVHWGKGKFGYFPSYTLGDVMAANWKQQVNSDLEKDLSDYTESADLEAVNQWMAENVWKYGKAFWHRSDYTSTDVQPYLEHLRTKADQLYG